MTFLNKIFLNEFKTGIFKSRDVYKITLQKRNTKLTKPRGLKS